jgi:hypothetical protein
VSDRIVFSFCSTEERRRSSACALAWSFQKFGAVES